MVSKDDDQRIIKCITEAGSWDIPYEKRMNLRMRIGILVQTVRADEHKKVCDDHTKQVQALLDSLKGNPR